MQPDIADLERLAVFVFDSGKMKADGVHWKAFRPDERGERSFFRIDGLDYAAIAAIGNEVAAERSQTLHGWAVLRADKARGVTPLQIRSDDPTSRHPATGLSSVGHPKVRMKEALRSPLPVLPAQSDTQIEKTGR
jgi:hypothetical protein